MIDIPAVVFGVILALLCALAGTLTWKATHNKELRFDFEELLLDDKGRTSLYKVGQFTALVVSTWGFVYLTLANQLTEWFFTGYMAAWAATNLTNKWLEMKGTQNAKRDDG